MITNLNIGYNGRLGNQLFQFAAVFGTAKKNGYDFTIPSYNTQPNHSRTMDGKPCVYRLELNDCFKLDRFLGEPTGLTQMATERHFHFDPAILQVPDNTTINGYFQSDKYFQHCREELLDALTFRDEISKSASALLPNTTKNLVSLHVRRGDYLHPNPYHPVLGTEYFDRAQQNFDEEENHFLVFSDDPDWCRQTWADKENFTVIDSGNNLVDLCAMSMCSHNIITNSSFSWWASYLNKNNDKRVIAPSNWFGPGYADYNLDDLYTKYMTVI